MGPVETEEAVMEDLATVLVAGLVAAGSATVRAGDWVAVGLAERAKAEEDLEAADLGRLAAEAEADSEVVGAARMAEGLEEVTAAGWDWSRGETEEAETEEAEAEATGLVGEVTVGEATGWEGEALAGWGWG